MQEKEDIIILNNKITPPVYAKKDYGIKEWDFKELKKHMQGKSKNLNEHLETISTESGTWKKDRYIIGKRTHDDKKYCEKVDPLDMYSMEKIRKYIIAVETFLSKKEDARSIDEQKGRVLKYVICFGLGMSIILWALWAGAIRIPNI